MTISFSLESARKKDRTVDAVQDAIKDLETQLEKTRGRTSEGAYSVSFDLTLDEFEKETAGVFAKFYTKQSNEIPRVTFSFEADGSLNLEQLAEECQELNITEEEYKELVLAITDSRLYSLVKASLSGELILDGGEIELSYKDSQPSAKIGLNFMAPEMTEKQFKDFVLPSRDS